MPYHQKNSLSQNFIKYPRLVAELLDSTEVNQDDLVIEIGAGKGIITRQLANKVKGVIAIEKDKKLAEELSVNIADKKNVKVINSDFLDYPLPQGPYKIVANIPFSITARIINKVLESPVLTESMHLIMQKEAAEKYLGWPTETQSSVLSKPWYEVEILGEIDRTNFTLKPQISVVYVRFAKRDSPYIKDQDKTDFRNFVIYGFNQFQPTIWQGFKKILTYTQLITIKKTLKIGDLKPSELSFDKWLLFFKSANKIIPEEKREILKNFRRHYKVSLE